MVSTQKVVQHSQSPELSEFFEAVVSAVTERIQAQIVTNQTSFKNSIQSLKTQVRTANQTINLRLQTMSQDIHQLKNQMNQTKPVPTKKYPRQLDNQRPERKNHSDLRQAQIQCAQIECGRVESIEKNIVTKDSDETTKLNDLLIISETGPQKLSLNQFIEKTPSKQDLQGSKGSNYDSQGFFEVIHYQKNWIKVRACRQEQLERNRVNGEEIMAEFDDLVAISSSSRRDQNLERGLNDRDEEQKWFKNFGAENYQVKPIGSSQKFIETFQMACHENANQSKHEEMLYSSMIIKERVFGEELDSLRAECAKKKEKGRKLPIFY